MGKRWSWVVAWSMLAVFVVSLVAGLILAVANGSFQQDAGNQVLLFVGFSAFMIVGALIVAHRPATPSAGSSRPALCWPLLGSWPANMPSTPLRPGLGRCQA